MTTDADEEPTRELDVCVPESLSERLDAAWERRGYDSRSEAVRDALYDWLEPPVTLSEETLDDLDTSREQADRGETLSSEEVSERLNRDDRP